MLLACFLVAATVSLVSPIIASGQTLTVGVIHSFDGTDGTIPAAALFKGSDGNLYGTTARGGKQQANGTNGTVFTFAPSNLLTPLHLFKGYRVNDPDKSDGSFPEGALVQGNDGNLYGTTTFGGRAGDGTIFVVTPGGALTLLHSFSLPSSNGTNSDGAYPQAGLTRGIDGNFYGTTYQGGESHDGTIFRLIPTGVFTVLHSFSGGDGAGPECPPTQGSDGNLYGTTDAGGSANQGSVYKITPGGELTVLHSFSGLGDDGASPYAALIQGTDGNFYGTTYAGGVDGGGTVFSITPDGVLTTLHDFSGASDGKNPQGTLIQDSEGNFYGTTYAGGALASSAGTVFEITPAGVLKTIHTFGSADDGASPESGLILGTDGNLYGTTTSGGAYGSGSIYRLNIVPLPVVTVTATVPSLRVGSGNEGTFTLNMSIAPTNKVTVKYTLKGSATNGTDYTLLSGSKTIKAGDTTRSIEVIPQGNLGGMEKKTVKLVIEPGTDYTVGDPSPVKITIFGSGD